MKENGKMPAFLQESDQSQAKKKAKLKGVWEGTNICFVYCWIHTILQSMYCYPQFTDEHTEPQVKWLGQGI